MGITVNPIQTINVRVGTQGAPRIQSSTNFVGYANLGAEIQGAYNTANAAVILSQEAYNTANSFGTQIQFALNQSNSAYLLANSVSSVANTSLAISQLAYNTANVGYNFVNFGGTVNGNITANGDIFGTIDAGSF